MCLIGVEPMYTTPEATTLPTGLQTHPCYDTIFFPELQVLVLHFYPFPLSHQLRHRVHQRHRQNYSTRDLKDLRQVMHGSLPAIADNTIYTVIDGCTGHQGQNPRHREHTNRRPENPSKQMSHKSHGRAGKKCSQYHGIGACLHRQIYQPAYPAN